MINDNQLVLEEREKLKVKLAIIMINWSLKLDSDDCLEAFNLLFRPKSFSEH